MSALTCNVDVGTTLPFVCLCSLFSFLCGVGIGANDLSANFAMVVGSGSLNMKQAIMYCTVFELLGAAFMGGHVSSTIRDGIVDPILFTINRDVVVIGMTASCFAAALWLYLSTVFGLPVSITHTVVGSLLGFAVFSNGSFQYVKTRGILVIVASWVLAPVGAGLVTAGIFYVMRREILNVKGRSFELAKWSMPYCLVLCLLVDFMFILIERPPIITQTLSAYVPVTLQFIIILVLIFVYCIACSLWYFPKVVEASQAALSFVWESHGKSAECVELQLSNTGVPYIDDGDIQGGVDSLFQDRKAPIGRSASEKRSLRKSPGKCMDSCLGHSSDGVRTCNCSFVLNPITPADSHITLRRSACPTPKAHRSPLISPKSGPTPHEDLAAPVEVLPIHMDLELPQESTSAPLRGPNAKGASKSDYGTIPNDIVSKLSLPPTDDKILPDDEFNEEDWRMDHPMKPINFRGLLIKPFNPRAEYLFTGLQVVAGSMSSFVHGAVAGANATAAFTILYEAFTNHELGMAGMSSRWAVLPAMMGIAIGMFGLGASLMRTVGMELVTVTPARGWCIQMGSTAVTMVLTAVGIPISLSQSQVGAAIGCGVLDARLAGVSWVLVAKIVGGWVVTLVISATTAGLTMWILLWMFC
ncbi:unnamed protein product [Phytomonas sp. EM1]|nr:unnamed protein product [Phytomonas sp. EM1]|eukprot:CCW59586.1 unnamed protein product [Phytomonas sp. isolate EM1]